MLTPKLPIAIRQVSLSEVFLSAIVMEWKVLSSEYLSDHPYFKARRDRCEMPDGRIVESYFVVELPVSVCALAITEDGQVVMARQYRHPVGKTLLEIPGGFIDPNEDPAEAVKRELLEETGYAFSEVVYAAKIAANPGVLSNYTYCYLALGGKKVAQQQLDQQEEIDVELIPVETVRTMLWNNEFDQALHATCLFYAFQVYDKRSESSMI